MRKWGSLSAINSTLDTRNFGNGTTVNFHNFDWSIKEDILLSFTTHTPLHIYLQKSQSLLLTLPYSHTLLTNMSSDKPITKGMYPMQPAVSAAGMTSPNNKNVNNNKNSDLDSDFTDLSNATTLLDEEDSPVLVTALPQSIKGHMPFNKLSGLPTVPGENIKSFLRKYICVADTYKVPDKN